MTILLCVIGEEDMVVDDFFSTGAFCYDTGWTYSYAILAKMGCLGFILGGWIIVLCIVHHHYCRLGVQIVSQFLELGPLPLLLQFVVWQVL